MTIPRFDGLVSPHGGRGLIDRLVPEVQRQSFASEARRHKAHIVTAADITTLYRIADGTLSPLEGPMDSSEFNSVLDREAIERNGTCYAWTIPIVLPAAKREAETFTVGETLALKDAAGVVVGTLTLVEIYPFDKRKYNSVVYGTERLDHPGPRIINEDPRDYLLAGKITMLPEIKSQGYGRYLLSPAQARALFAQKKWERVVAFQTRNPLHRAHEYAMVYALEYLIREGAFAGVVLNPLVGETKKDDIPADVRMRTYEVLLQERLIGQGDKDAALWRTKKYDLVDQIELIALDTRMFYAGPKEAVMHAIYRQNFGFTDIIIGRRHADAPFDDGTQAWGDFDAQEKFTALSGELSIRPLRVGQAGYCQELGRVAFVEEFKAKGYHEISISGKELRQKFEHGQPVDERVMRKPVSELLSEAYTHNIGALRSGITSKNIVWHDYGISKQDRESRNGHKGRLIWFTGLSCSGKSTIATMLQSVLFKAGCFTYVLDGDNIRHGLNKDLGFSARDREENIRRIGEVAKLFTDAGVLVFSAFISPYRKDRDAVRSLFVQGDFIEVFVNADLAVCEQRDVKGLYKKARLGEIPEFTGISAPYEEPYNPELVLATDTSSASDSVSAVVAYLMKTNSIGPDIASKIK